jgi:endoglucanase
MQCFLTENSNMFKRIAISALVFACACCAASFTSTYGKLSVNGGKILDKNNNEIVLRGMSLYWYNGPWSGNQPGNSFYTSSVVSALANDWNANVVRAAIGNVQQSPSDALTMAKNMMDWANSAGTYVIIDNHSHIAHRSAHATAANNFFRDVSAYVKQKNYTHVLYEIYNEPVCDNDQATNMNASSCTRTTWAQIKSFAQPVINTIRGNDPDGLIIIGTPNYSSSISAARADPISGGRNLLYTLHFYAGESGHGVYRDALRAAYCNNFPVFTSEWGTSPASGNGAINTSNSNTWLSLLEAAKVSHANWSLSNTNETSAALSSTNVNGSLTASGTYIKNIFKLNTGATLANVGLTQETINCDSGGNEPSGPDGRIRFGESNRLANFASKNGADSSTSASYGAVLINSSANFTANYTIIDVPSPGVYLIDFYLASAAGGSVSWSGNRVSSGSAQIENTGSIDAYRYTESAAIGINEAPETPLSLSFQTPSANSLKALHVRIRPAGNAADSAKIAPIIVKNLVNLKHWSYDAITNSFVFEKNEGTLSVYNLRGEKLKTFTAQGRISINALPSGTYIAVYRQGSQTSAKTIHLK